MKKAIISLFAILSAFGALAQGGSSLIEDALKVNALTEGREAAIADFNAKYLTVRPGTSLVDTPHILFPDSTFYGANKLDDNILPLAFGFVPEDVRAEVEKNVIAAVKKLKYRPSVSPEVEPYVLKVLDGMGQNRLAYFICDEHPEMKTNDCIDRQYVKEWREQCLAGVTVQEGKAPIRLKPDFGIDEMEDLEVEVETPYGPVHSSFTKDMMHAEWEFSIPKGVKAEVYTPTSTRSQVKRRCLARKVRTEDGFTVWRVRGGKHHFSVDFDMPEGIVEKQFVYNHESFPQCHASTLCFAENGDLLCSFYGGTGEHFPDTKAYLCRKVKGTDVWTRPEAVGAPDKDRYCLDNPVLFRIPEPGQPLLLFYKERPGYNVKEGVIDISTISMWEARLRKSFDNGYTWTEPEAVPDGFLGPIKDKPVYHGGRIICGSSYEPKYEHLSHRIHFEWTDDCFQTWHKFQPEADTVMKCSLRKPGRVGENKDVPANPDFYYGNYREISSIQPTIFIHKDGSLQALCRTDHGKMSTTWSYDNGEYWTRETLTDMPQNGAGIDGTTLPDGRFALVYNDFETLPGRGGSPRTPLVLALSEDGINWTNVLTLENDPIKEYSYPAVICDSEYIHISYTWRRYIVKYVKVRIADLKFEAKNKNTYTDMASIESNPNYIKALEFIEKTDLNSLSFGKHVIDGDNLWVNIAENDLKNVADARYEAHDQYIDIQIPLSRDEEMGVIPRAMLQHPDGEMDTVKDIIFYNDPVNCVVNVKQGTKIVFGPETAHAPLLGEGKIKKAVFKVKVVE